MEKERLRYVWQHDIVAEIQNNAESKYSSKPQSHRQFHNKVI